MPMTEALEPAKSDQKLNSPSFQIRISYLKPRKAANILHTITIFDSPTQSAYRAITTRNGVHRKNTARLQGIIFQQSSKPLSTPRDYFDQHPTRSSSSNLSSTTSYEESTQTPTQRYDECSSGLCHQPACKISKPRSAICRENSRRNDLRVRFEKLPESRSSGARAPTERPSRSYGESQLASALQKQKQKQMKIEWAELHVFFVHIMVKLRRRNRAVTAGNLHKQFQRGLEERNWESLACISEEECIALWKSHEMPRIKEKN
ncbi:uncharacterized protein BDZ99DRAFT_504257 [Mytilinidion resinicola]|uniref:Uncharacterized protein n=1 Tax=Mytilinidion resinicola TaxID=574789 RepID=A0A6A6XZR3_9PEZI|nr:uncharacterized protein BDZ99DRAFT_504257 [Mytilinidion resinicola]KAF2802012.1 hypothetical protein BDZ99DRAFT_504257 [Mytilinidion resinicola]